MRVTASFGIAHTANDPCVLETLLFEADQALYMSNAKGGTGFMHPLVRAMCCIKSRIFRIDCCPDIRYDKHNI